MRTLTVKETALALGVSIRTVQNRLNTGELKGMRTPNQYGVKEWRVWPNKEIMERLGPGKVTDDFNLDQPSEEFLGGDSSAVVDAETIDGLSESFDESERSLRVFVRELTQQFAEQLSREKEAIVQLQRDLEDKDRQLKLLPDLEKQAENRRKESELRELESEALRKQIAALQEKEQMKTLEFERLHKVEKEVLPDLQRQLEQEKVQKAAEIETKRREAEEVFERQLEAEKAAKESEVNQLKSELEDNRRTKELEVKALEERLASVEEYKKVSEESQRKLDDLQRALDERNEAEQQKASETAAIREELSSLSAKLQQAQTPFWKKWFSTKNDA